MNIIIAGLPPTTEELFHEFNILIKFEIKQIARNQQLVSRYLLVLTSPTTAASLTISRTFLRAFARSGIHIARIIARRYTAALWAFHLVEIGFYQLVEFFAALLAFIL